jgi:hypothetical protein
MHHFHTDLRIRNWPSIGLDHKKIQNGWYISLSIKILIPYHIPNIFLKFEKSQPAVPGSTLFSAKQFFLVVTSFNKFFLI